MNAEYGWAGLTVMQSEPCGDVCLYEAGADWSGDAASYVYC